MNTMVAEMRRSLKELDLGLKGELTITSDMEALSDSLFFDEVTFTDFQNQITPPKIFKGSSLLDQACLCLAQRALCLVRGSSFADQGKDGCVEILIISKFFCKELEGWTSDFNLPSSVWLPGFFNPQSFLTAIMQSTARKNELPLDKMCLTCEVTKKQAGEMQANKSEGAYTHGLFMEGARWDIAAGSIAESNLKELYPSMPVMYIKAVTQDKQETRNFYECPVYKTRQRGDGAMLLFKLHTFPSGPTYIWTFNLKTKERPSKWVLAGVALLLQI